MSVFDLTDSNLFVQTTTGENITQASSQLAPTRLEVYFKDINNDFRRTSSALIVKGRSAIDGQLSNLLATPIGSEPFEPTYGSDLPLRIFEPIDRISAATIEQDTIRAVHRWMSSVITVSLANTFVIPLETEEGYRINLPYYYDHPGNMGMYEATLLR